ncbi:MIP/aquaporin family protein [Mycoplasma phocimorsus]|uniref:MIP/aquaporin family protein n=1 Tax=Mycoplasma phocimorsus TaxID=3045839 RepID=A0AAJ1PTT2_9MOLU|nr:MIP/aquaporin family protein [Mycoplasma phocimorsus]MDJ1646057.1 MIP/aquaporin family protein [Mycoplasma phocimorsus]MDJ1647074.1 MIP/aquaporin family protein [Mycoplasma phocimorsus]MDJ1647514.1 MIP/aquaporin family protein [Mycoplasma phocimorsus]MDJ1648132.1 MIP/aquaporin family protein [Mycoplasma phocimorsus]MDJ1649159.1 MIP/aquaporin family protein [Mycoplasma phocimorsus]
MIYLSEFLGTLFLILLGNGVVYSVSAKRMFANQSGKWIVIVMGWGFAVMVGVIISLALNGAAHLNPAVTIWSWVSGKFSNHLQLIFIPMQILGAMAAQIILNFINWKHIQETELIVVRSAHSTGPAYNHKEGGTIFNFAYELIGTLVLLGTIVAIGKANISNLGPLPVTFLVMSIGISLGSSTGYAINPARDLGPRIIYFFTEKIFLRKRKQEHIGANWAYSWIPVIAPIIAGFIIGGLSLL